MSERNRIRRAWTHRRLGIGASPVSDVALAQTDALLAAVGARQVPSTGLGVSEFDSALFDYVCAVDLAAGVPGTDAAPIPLPALRAEPAPARRRRVTWRVLIPAAATGLAGMVLATFLVLGDQDRTSPELTATAQSKQLLNHADMLLTAAKSATASERTKLVAEAKADLNHVSRLLPLAVAQARPAIRTRLRQLDERVSPLPRHHSVSQTTSDRVDSSPARSETPQHTQQPARRRPVATTDSGRDPGQSSASAGGGQGGRRPAPIVTDTDTDTDTGERPRPVADSSPGPRPQGGQQPLPDRQPPIGEAPRPPRP